VKEEKTKFLNRVSELLGKVSIIIIIKESKCPGCNQFEMIG